jgi:hypothetical protein
MSKSLLEHKDYITDNTMTKSDEKKFMTAIEPFIRRELSFVVTEDDIGKGVSGGLTCFILNSDGYNYEISRNPLGQLNKEIIEYRIRKTKAPYFRMNRELHVPNVITETAWVCLKTNGKLNINGYKLIKHKQNICPLCKLCDPKTKIACAFNINKHNETKKHTNNVVIYNANIRDTLNKKKIGEDMIN